MAVRGSNRLLPPLCEPESVDVLLASTNTAGSYQTTADMSDYAWIIICGLNSGYYNSTVTIPYVVFKQGAVWWVTTYQSSTQRRISAQYVDDTHILVGSPSGSQSVKVVGVK